MTANMTQEKVEAFDAQLNALGSEDRGAADALQNAAAVSALSQLAQMPRAGSSGGRR